MEFIWGMTEKNWENLVNDHKKHNVENMSSDFDFYGNCCIGNLCAEVVHTGDESDETSWYSYTNIYALGIDDGYGETDNGIPYSLLHDSFKIPIEAETFEKFKEIFESRFENLVNHLPSDTYNNNLCWKDVE